jgi:hypothetical protein
MRIRMQPAVVWAFVGFGVALGVVSEAFDMSTHLSAATGAVGVLILVVVAVRTAGRSDDPHWKKK